MPYHPPLKQNTRFESLKDESSNLFKSDRTRRQKNKDRTSGRRRSSLRDKIKRVQDAAPKPFNLESHSFPNLGQGISQPKDQGPVTDFSHIKDIKEDVVVKQPEDTIEKGWIRYIKIDGSWYKEEFVRELQSEIETETETETNVEKLEQGSYSDYPSIDERFDAMRHNMNELLGDCSPYWGKSYPWDSGYESDNYAYDDNDD